MKALAILVAAAIVVATVLSNLGYGERFFFFVKHVPGGDLTAHFGLYAVLGFAVDAWVSRSQSLGPLWARALLMGGIAAVIALEEFSQSYIPARQYSLLDLRASLVGLAVGWALSMLVRRLSRRTP